jgi:hypothetical protein
VRLLNVTWRLIDRLKNGGRLILPTLLLKFDKKERLLGLRLKVLADGLLHDEKILNVPPAGLLEPLLLELVVVQEQ